MSFILGVKWVSKIQVWYLIFAVNACEASHGVGTSFAPNAVSRSHGLQITTIPLIRLLLLFNKHNKDRLQIQTHSEISKFSICNEACPTQSRVACTKVSGKLRLLAMTTLILMKITDSKKGTMSIAIRHLKQHVPHLNAIY
jgi:hypothetical protein